MKRFSAAGITALLVIIGGASGLAGQSMELVSRIDPSQTSDTGAGFQYSTSIFSPSISADGRYVVFGSRATNLVPGQQDANHERDRSGLDIFLQDLVTGTTTLVSRSLSSPATAGNLPSEEAVISRDGRYVAFTSRATDLAPGQPDLPFNEDEDLLLYDRVTGTTSLLAAAPRNTGAASFANLAISADGRYVAFTSNIDPLSGQRYDYSQQAFLYDGPAKTVRLVSHTSGSATTGGDGSSSGLSISSDGQHVLFISYATDLVPGQVFYSNAYLYDRSSGALTALGEANNAAISADGRYVALDSDEVYLYDRVTREKVLLGYSANFYSSARSAAISDDGRYVAFTSSADDLVPGQQESIYGGLFLYDRVARSYTLVSRRDGSPTTPGRADSPTISGDGRWIAFGSDELNLVAGQTQASNYQQNIFLFDRTSGRMSLVSHAGASPFTTGNSYSYLPTVSADGSRVVFNSEADDLVAGLTDLNRRHDVFAYETSTEKTVAVSARAPEMPSLSAMEASEAKALSADGRFVVFESSSPRLIAGQADTNGETDIFLYDRATRSTVLVSRSTVSPTQTARRGSFRPIVNADGRYVVFLSEASDLVAGGGDSRYDDGIFLFDRIPGTVTRIGRTSSYYSEGVIARISPDGRWVVFSSDMADLIPGQQDESDEYYGDTLDVFLWDRLTGTTSLVSRSTAGPLVTGNGNSSMPTLSADGRFVAFISTATDLIPGQIDENQSSDLFLYDRTTGGITLVSHAADSPLTAAGITQRDFSMTPDGSFLVFANSWQDLDPNPPVQGSGGIYLHDRGRGTNEWLFDDDFSYSGSRISDNGRWVVFLSDRTLVPGFQNDSFRDQVYLYDRISKTLLLVSKPAFATGRTSDGETREPSISADGRYVTFLSDATNLVAGQTADPERTVTDLFLFDRVAGTMTLVSHSRTSPTTAMGQAFAPLLSASGRQVAFTHGRDLVGGDFNLLSDAYVFSLDPPPPVTLPNCKLIDTRRRADRPVLTSNVQRTVTAHGACGVPATAKQVVVNVTVFNPSGKGNLRFYPGAVTAAPSGILRFEPGTTRTETFILPLSTNGTLTVLPFVASRGTVHVAVEVTGYSQ